MQLGQVRPDAAQDEGRLPGRSGGALLVALSSTWELMNSIFIAAVLAPHSLELLPQLLNPSLSSLPCIRHAAGRAIFLSALSDHVHPSSQALHHSPVARIRKGTGSNLSPWQTLRIKCGTTVL